jgi:hypothetical protein
MRGIFCPKPLRKEEQKVNRMRRKHSPGFGAKVAPVAMREDGVPDTRST